MCYWESIRKDKFNMDVIYYDFQVVHFWVREFFSAQLVFLLVSSS